METQNVTPDASGQYSVLLGSTTATGLPSDLFSQEEQRWLGVQVQGQAEQPRVLLVSVPYAFKAHEAETLAGKSISDFVLAKDCERNQFWRWRRVQLWFWLDADGVGKEQQLSRRPTWPRSGADQLQRHDH